MEPLIGELAGLHVQKSFNLLGYVLDNRIDPEYMDRFLECTVDGNTALHVAAMDGSASNMAMCLGKAVGVGSEKIINAANLHGSTPLHLAVKRRSLGVVRLLVVYGADTRALDRCKNTPLAAAVEFGDVRLCEALTDPVSGRQLSRAGFNCDLSPLAQALENYNYDGHTCLHLAVGINQPYSHVLTVCELDVVALVIGLGANVNARSMKSGETPLLIAIRKNDIRLVSLLSKSMDLDIELTDYNGVSPMVEAVEGERLVMVDLLAAIAAH